MIAPLLVIWWGFGIVPKLVVIVLICFFPILVTTVDALSAVDRDQLKLLRTLDATRWQAFRFAELPAALPAAHQRRADRRSQSPSSAPTSPSPRPRPYGPYAGLGHEIVADVNALQTPARYAAAVVLFALAIACFYALTLAERRLAPWAIQPRGDTR